MGWVAGTGLRAVRLLDETNTHCPDVVHKLIDGRFREAQYSHRTARRAFPAGNISKVCINPSLARLRRKMKRADALLMEWHPVNEFGE